jgi:hypothetical protein
MKVRILTSGFDDLAAGRRFYDLQRMSVGDYFFDSLFSEIDSLAIYAGTHGVHFGYHRMLARRFPYAIYYRVTGAEVMVYRVLDCRREPNWIKRALETKG